MEIKEIIKGFELFQEGISIGHVDFHQTGGVLKITHTQVSEEYSGQGLARKLILAAVDYAQKNNLKVLPLCAAASHVLNKEEFGSILAS